ncbi:MAG TPA: hypothetical protein DCF45_03035 [Gammaproteobacteria bacterium]|nr:hypothetical protein [Gammaproteobacteria bacterium]
MSQRNKQTIPYRLSAAVALALTLFSLGFARVAWADQDNAIGSGNSASANLDFRIQIPTFLVFRLGTAGAGNVDLIDFDLVTGAIVPGSGGPIAATAGSGDQGNGSVTVGILTNANGNLSTTVTAAATGLSDGGTNTISFADITTDDTGTTLQAPQLVDGTSAAATTAVTGITNTLASGQSWTYSYDNTATPAAGTYGGVNVNDGRVTYAVALP